MAIWPNLIRSGESQYDFAKLIDSQQRPMVSRDHGSHCIICDIDKTYLETAFESLLHMAKVAFESPQDKVTVLGAKEVLVAARWSQVKQGSSAGPNQLHFVSSSPTQLRSVLEEKLLLDGMDWTSDTFKDQVYNIVRGRMDLLRQHVAYKSAAILSVVATAKEPLKLHLIGDNAESDAFIYIGVALRLGGILDADSYAEYIQAAGIEEKVAQQLSQRFLDLPQHEVASILIRNAPGYSFHEDEFFTSPIRTFDHYFQAAILLINSGLISPKELPSLARRFHNQYGYRRKELCSNLIALSEQAATDSVAEHARRAVEMLQKIGEVGTQRKNLDFSPSSFSKLTEASPSEIVAAAKHWHESRHQTD